MKAIYACKLYRSSPRKAAIEAAMQNPINMELVKQLRSYLDEEYQTDEYLDLGHDEADYVENIDEESEEIRPSESSGGAGGGGGHSFDEFDLPDATDVPEVDIPDTGDVDSVEPSGIDTGNMEDEVSEAEDISGVVESDIDYNKDPDGVKELLNSDDATAGVYRASLKSEDEIWIYYNDKINLNNVMESVIYKLANSNYSGLEFNRLARTENAIVFELPISSIPE